jgi:hypothetical protein
MTESLMPTGWSSTGGPGSIETPPRRAPCSPRTASTATTRSRRPTLDVPNGAPLTLAGEFLLTFAEGGLCRELRECWVLTEARVEPPAGWGL